VLCWSPEKAHHLAWTRQQGSNNAVMGQQEEQSSIHNSKRKCRLWIVSLRIVKRQVIASCLLISWGALLIAATQGVLPHLMISPQLTCLTKCMTQLTAAAATKVTAHRLSLPSQSHLNIPPITFHLTCCQPSPNQLISHYITLQETGCT